MRNWQFTTSGIKLLNVANIEKGGTLNLEKTDRHLDENEVAKKYSHFLVDAGDLVIASSGISFDDDGLLRTRGAFVRGEHLPLCLNTSTIRFKAIDGMSDLRFLRLWLNGHEFRSQITKFVTGTAQQNFGPSHLKATKITLPPLAEQRRIAEVLDRAEALRAKRRAALAQLDSLTQSIFLDLFGDPVVREDHSQMVEFGRLTTRITYGFTCPMEHLSEGIPIITAKNVRQGFIDFQNCHFASVAQFETLTDKCKPEVGDLLITKDGAIRGRCAMVETHSRFCISQAVALIRPDRSVAIPEYLWGYIVTDRIQRKIMDMDKGVAMPHLQITELAKFPVLLPPISLQREFARRVTAVETLKTAHRASLAELDALFASLQHRAFRGEL